MIVYLRLKGFRDRLRRKRPPLDISKDRRPAMRPFTHRKARRMPTRLQQLNILNIYVLYL